MCKEVYHRGSVKSSHGESSIQLCFFAESCQAKRNQCDVTFSNCMPDDFPPKNNCILLWDTSGFLQDTIRAIHKLRGFTDFFATQGHNCLKWRRDQKMAKFIWHHLPTWFYSTTTNMTQHIPYLHPPTWPTFHIDKHYALNICDAVQHVLFRSLGSITIVTSCKIAYS